MFLKYSVKLQILLGIILGALNFGMNCLQSFNPIPLYMDTLFTITASFFGPVSGCISAVLLHALSVIIRHHVLSSLWWSICSFSVVLIIRIFVRFYSKESKKKIDFFEILLLIVLIALIISLEGALIFTVLHSVAQYREDSQVRQMYLLLNRNSIPVFISALLPRLPVNLLDKAICVSLGYWSFVGLDKLLGKFGRKDKLENEQTSKISTELS